MLKKEERDWLVGIRREKESKWENVLEKRNEYSGKWARNEWDNSTCTVIVVINEYPKIVMFYWLLRTLYNYCWQNEPKNTIWEGVFSNTSILRLNSKAK